MEPQNELKEQKRTDKQKLFRSRCKELHTIGSSHDKIQTTVDPELMVEASQVKSNQVKISFHVLFIAQNDIRVS